MKAIKQSSVFLCVLALLLFSNSYRPQATEVFNNNLLDLNILRISTYPFGRVIAVNPVTNSTVAFTYIQPFNEDLYYNFLEYQSDWTPTSLVNSTGDIIKATGICAAISNADTSAALYITGSNIIFGSTKTISGSWNNVQLGSGGSGSTPIVRMAFAPSGGTAPLDTAIAVYPVIDTTDGNNIKIAAALYTGSGST